MSLTTIFDFTTPSNYTFVNTHVVGSIASLIKNNPVTFNKTSNFGTPSDYTFDNTKIAVASNMAALASIIQSATFSQNYASSTGFTFNSSATSIGGGSLSQIDQLFIPTFTNLVNVSAVSDTITKNAGGTGFNAGATSVQQITGDGFVQVTGNTQGSCLFGLAKINPNGDYHQIDYALNLSAGFLYAFELGVNVGPFPLAPYSNGDILQVKVTGTTVTYEKNGSVVYTSLVPASFPYYFACSINVQGDSFIGIRLQNAAAQYMGDTITYPLFTTVSAPLVSWNSATVTDTNSPGYILNGLYWNGSAWVTSNNTYAQTTSAANVVAHITTLPISNTLQVVAITQSGTTQETASLFSVNYSYSVFSTSNPTIALTPGQAISDVNLNAITNITASIVASGSDAVQFSVSVNGGVSYIYWNGSMWVASSSYVQSNPLSVIVANLASLPLTTEFILQAYLHSATGVTTPTLANVVVTYQDLLYGSGTIQSNAGVMAQHIDSFTSVFSQSGGDTVTFALVVNGVLMYWNGSAWVNSNGTLGQTNTAAVINTNAPSLLSVNSIVKVFAFLNSSSSLTTPNITSMTVTYDFGQIAPPEPATTVVYGFLSDLVGAPVANASIIFSLVNLIPNAYMEAADHVLVYSSVTATTDANGYFEQAIIATTQFQGTNTFIQVVIQSGTSLENVNSAGKPLYLNIPIQQSIDITSILSA